MAGLRENCWFSFVVSNTVLCLMDMDFAPGGVWSINLLTRPGLFIT